MREASRPNQTIRMGKTTTEVSQEVVTQFKKTSLWVGGPARIIGTTDYERLQCVDVEFMIKEVLDDDRQLDSLIIKKVFVALPSSGGFKLSFPINNGDLVNLHWCHKSLSRYLDSDGSTPSIQPESFIQSPRDCYVTLDGGTRRTNTIPSLTDVVLRGPNSTVTIKPDGTVTNKVTKYTVDGETEITKSLKVKEDLDVTEDFTVGGDADITGKTTSGSTELGNSVSTNGVAGITGVAGPTSSITVVNGIVTAIA